jgi:DNA-binding transcriptional ArsR family regulator
MYQSEKPLIRLETEHQLRIYSLPLRQKILRTMRIHGEPITAKQVADHLGISPSSSRHHLLKLREIGLVEHDRYELIHGIRADYLRLTDVNVSIGTNLDDPLSFQREATTRIILSDITNRFIDTLSNQRNESMKDPNHFSGDLITGIAHLSQADAKRLYDMVGTFLDEHALPTGNDESAWEFAFLCYETNH